MKYAVDCHMSAGGGVVGDIRKEKDWIVAAYQNALINTGEVNAS